MMDRSPEPLTLGDKEVHVWHVSLDLPVSQIQRLGQTLSEEERRRAERYRFQKDRTRFIVSHGVLRTILGRYLKTKPGRVRFCCNACGKPELAEETGNGALRFNMSHAHERALYAVTYGRAVGVDIEYIRPDLAEEKIAERFFSPLEVAVLRALPKHMQPRAFLNCWTRKEAYIKARGQGLSMALDRFDMSLTPGAPAALLSVNGDHQEASRWSLRELPVGSDYVAALAVEGQGWLLRCGQWTEQLER